ncbi:terminase large subunit domain-containing protein [Embleya sp. NPDC050154]|uniref:phage terminase large subunit family protein n=1 Tax=Embleya sp. NPDC050154 TaxID=3363988 RepID=UPI00379D0A7B
MTSSLRERLEALPPAALELLRDELAARLWARRWGSWTPYPWQICPSEVETHGTWLLMGGRGTGKTDGAARYVAEHVNGPACDRRIPGGHRIGIVAPTQGDAVESFINGPSGLKAHDPRVVLRTSAGGTHVRWPNGAEGKVFGAHSPDDVERLRSGGNRCLYAFEEAAAMRRLDEALTHSAMGLRIGPRPHYVMSTTPKPRAEIRALVAAPDTVLTRGRTRDAWHLPEVMRAKLIARYAGTRTARQELDGEILDDIEGALWTWALLDLTRVREAPPLARVCVAIDPAVSNTSTSDETGIVVAGTARLRTPDTTGTLRAHGYVLDDLSGRYSPTDWARRAVDAYHLHRADCIIAEANQGGDMVKTTIHAVDRNVPVRLVHATRGKLTRAEPVSALYEQQAVHMVGSLPELEDQLTTWVPGEGDSPDRLDAHVWAITHLMIRAVGNVAAVA